MRFLPGRKSFTTRRPSSLTRNGWIRVAPIVQNSPLLPPVGVWTVSQFQCDGSSSHTSSRAAVRLACVKHSASVQSEPGSNSSVQSLHLLQYCFAQTQNELTSIQV